MNNDKKILLTNLDKIHTTILGKERIIKNLEIKDIDIIKYLKKLILKRESLIYKKGKNFYCEIDNLKITINSYNYCIITAHVMNEKKTNIISSC